MADLKFKHGFERAQFRRRPSVQIQALLTAAVINLKQLVKRRPEAQSGKEVAVIKASRQALRGAQAALSAAFQASLAPDLVLTRIVSSFGGTTASNGPFGNRPSAIAITGMCTKATGRSFGVTTADRDHPADR
jgi:hypothetical protein